MNYENNRGDHVLAAILAMFGGLILWLPVANGDLVLLTGEVSDAEEMLPNMIGGGVLLLGSLLVVFDQMSTPGGFLSFSAAFVGAAVLTFVDSVQVFEPGVGAFFLLVFGSAAVVLFVRSLFVWLSKDGQRLPIARSSWQKERRAVIESRSRRG